MPLFGPVNEGEDGLSTREVWYGDSIEEAELEYLKWPGLENVGVTGEGFSDCEEFGMYGEDERSTSESHMPSLFLRSSTNCGRNSGLSFGDILVVGEVVPEECCCV